MKRKTISCDPNVMGGTPVFAGTRVPVRTLLDYLKGGETVDDFLNGFPTVKRAQVMAFLEAASKHTRVAEKKPRPVRRGWEEAMRDIPQESLERDFEELRGFRETPNNS